MIRRVIVMICVILLFSGIFAAAANAETGVEFPNNEAGLGGYELRYEYSDESKLLEIDIKGAIACLLSDIASGIMHIIAIIGWNVIKLFRFALGQNLAKTAGETIENFLGNMKENVFDYLFLLGFAMTAVVMVKQFAKRNLKGMGITFCTVIGVYVLMMFIAQNAQSALVASTEMSKNIGLQLMGEKDNGYIPHEMSKYVDTSSKQDYNDVVANELWDDLVYKMWKKLQFMDSKSSYIDVSDELAEKFLHVQRWEKTFEDLEKSRETDPSGNDKPVYDYIADARNKENKVNNAFDPSYGLPRIGYLSVYFIPFLVKCIVYLAISGLLLLFQFLAIFLVCISPFVLILSLFPMFGGFEVLSKWFRKLVETQVMIVLIMFLLVFIIKANEFLVLPNNGPPTIDGHIATTFLQAGVAILLLWKHKEVLAFVGVQKTAAVGAVSHGVGRIKSHIQHRQMSKSIERTANIRLATAAVIAFTTADVTTRALVKFCSHFGQKSFLDI